MDFVDSVKTCFSKYATFSGRASRSEYWWFTLFTWIVDLVLLTIEAGTGLVFLKNVFSLIVFIPGLAVCCRRLHDTNRSGWLQLLPLALILGSVCFGFFAVGATGGAELVFGFSTLLAIIVFFIALIILFVLMVCKGTVGPNKYGEDPLAEFAYEAGAAAPSSDPRVQTSASPKASADEFWNKMQDKPSALPQSTASVINDFEAKAAADSTGQAPSAAKPAQPAYCANCGAPFGPNDKFCGSCGAKRS